MSQEPKVIQREQVNGREDFRFFLVPMNGKGSNAGYELVSEDVSIGTDPSYDIFVSQLKNYLPKVVISPDFEYGVTNVITREKHKKILINGEPFKSQRLMSGDNLTIGTRVFKFKIVERVSERELEEKLILRKKILYVFTGLLALWIIFDEPEYERRERRVSRRETVRQIGAQKRSTKYEDQIYKDDEIVSVLSNVKRELKFNNSGRAFRLIYPLYEQKPSNKEVIRIYKKVLDRFQSDLMNSGNRFQLLLEQNKFEESKRQLCRSLRLVKNTPFTVQVLKITETLNNLFRKGQIKNPKCDPS